MSELQNVPTDQSECGDITLHGPPIPDTGENDAANHCVQSSDLSSCVPLSLVHLVSITELHTDADSFLGEQSS